MADTDKISRFFESRIMAAASLLILFAAMLFVYLGDEYRSIGGYGFNLDDSWIHATFARNLAEGKGFAFNPHENVSGSTAPLFTFLLAGSYLIFGNMLWCAKLLGILGALASGWFLYLAAEKLSQSRFVAWIVAAFFFLSPPMMWSALGGMEIMVYMITPCAALYFFALERYRWMTVMLALGVWLRPDSVFLLALGWLAIPNREKIASLVIGSALIFPYFAFNYWLSDFPFPITVAAKHKQQARYFSTEVLESMGNLLSAPHFFPLFFLVPFGFVKLKRKAWWAAIFPLCLFLIAWIAFGTAASFGRYLFPMFPFLFLTIAFAVIWFWEKLPAYKIQISAIALLLVAVQAVYGYYGKWMHGLSVENITHMQVNIAKMAGKVTAKTDTIATNDIGALGYFSDRYILDIFGLISPMENFEVNLHKYHPAMLVMFDSWYPERNFSPTFQEEYNPYHLGTIGLTKNVVCGDSVMEIYARKDRFEEFSQKLEGYQPTN